ncbi:MAG: hypothetical protein J4G13_00280 [Dehalococcoidia bacterium]|nr:hypothetical protein [Dehalococcoidia bacterium]
MVNGVPQENAFRLRPGEKYLSTNWLEHFHDADRQAQIAGVRQALTDKGFRVRGNTAFAVLNVGTAIAVCKSDLDMDIQIATLGESHDPSHTGIFGYTEDDTDVVAILARQVNHREVYPAAPSPNDKA